MQVILEGPKVIPVNSVGLGAVYFVLNYEERNYFDLEGLGTSFNDLFLKIAPGSMEMIRKVTAVINGSEHVEFRRVSGKLWRAKFSTKICDPTFTWTYSIQYRKFIYSNRILMKTVTTPVRDSGYVISIVWDFFQRSIPSRITPEKGTYYSRSVDFAVGPAYTSFRHHGLGWIRIKSLSKNDFIIKEIGVTAFNSYKPRIFNIMGVVTKEGDTIARPLLLPYTLKCCDELFILLQYNEGAASDYFRSKFIEVTETTELSECFYIYGNFDSGSPDNSIILNLLARYWWG